jgi:uncharacterized protein
LNPAGDSGAALTVTVNHPGVYMKMPPSLLLAAGLCLGPALQAQLALSPPPDNVEHAPMPALDQALTLAIRGGDTPGAMELLTRGADARAADANGDTPLHDAVVFNGAPELATALLRGGADVNARNQLGDTPLSAALRSAHYLHASDGPARVQAIVALLLTHGASVATADSQSIQPIAQALDRKQIALVELLLEHGAQVPDDALQRVLRADGEAIDLALAWRLLEGASPQLLHSRGDDGQSVAHLAAGRPIFLPILQQLAATGADLTASDARGTTVFGAAAFGSNIPAMEFLSARGAMQIDAVNDERQTPLHLAAYSARMEVLQWLVDHGAPLTPRDTSERRALDIATDTPRFAWMRPADQLSLVDLLGGNQQDLARGRMAQHPLHLAIRARDLPAIERLLQGGADPDVRNEHGHAPLYDAISYSSTLPASAAEHAFGRRLLPLLLRHGADPLRLMDLYARTNYIDFARSLRVDELLTSEMRRFHAAR